MSAAVPALHHRNRRTAGWAALLVAAMVVLGFASVPLYRLFCQVTGYGGTTQRVSMATASAVEVGTRAIQVRFDSNVNPGLPWSFRPERAVDTVSVGARDMAIYLARNEGAAPVTGTATFNVTPEAAGKYFNKIQCFCFTEQTLAAGESVRMPVLYYVDPAIATDPETRDIEQITLSYTFYRSTGGRAVDGAGTAG